MIMVNVCHDDDGVRILQGYGLIIGKKTLMGKLTSMVQDIVADEEEGKHFSIIIISIKQ